MSRKQPCEPKDCQDYKQAQKQKYVQQEPDYCYDPVCSSAHGKRVDTIQGLYQDFTNIENSINKPGSARRSKRPSSATAPEREVEILQTNACPDPECGNAHAKTLRTMEMLNEEMLAIEKATKKRPISTRDVYDELQTIQFKGEKDTSNACRDPICSEHEKKVVDLNSGVNALEDILKNMTGLCRQPNCPDAVEKPPKPKMKPFTEEMPPLPVPHRYTISDTDFEKKTGHDGDQKEAGSKTLRELLNFNDLKTCKGPKCYSAYMGYTYAADEPKGENLCSNPTCIPFPKSTPEKQVCGAPVCPFNKPKYDLGLGDTTKSYNYGTTGNSFNLDKPCTFETCPLDKSGKDSSYGKPGTTPCGHSKCPYTFDTNTSQPTELGYSGPPKVGICGRTSCPYASIVPNVQQIGQGHSCGGPGCPFKETYEPVGLCGQPNCPFISSTSPGSLKPCPYAGQVKRYPCGSPSCPHVNPSGMLRTHEYQNDKSFVQEAARPYAGSASPYDYMSSLNTSYPSPYATNYSLFSYTDPPQANPCPYMPKNSKKSCGSANCPYGRKGKPQTDNFCISQTCPHDQGIEERRFSCNVSDEESAASVECPLCHAKAKKKNDPCANESCPYAEGICGKPKKFSCDYPGNDPCAIDECPIHQQDNCGSVDCPVNKKKKQKICKCCGKPKAKPKSCLSNNSSEQSQSDQNPCPKSCPFSTGICGGPRIYSCDNPDVQPCGTEECPITNMNKKKKCKCCGKRDNPTTNPCSCGGEPDDVFGSQESLEQIDEDCDCGKQKRKNKLKTCPFANSHGGGDDKCGSKTCPFLARLVFCDDCGGVLPEELNSCCTCSGSAESDTSGHSGNDGNRGRDSIKKNEARDSNASGKNALVPVDQDKKKKKEDKEKKVEITSLYNYPGVQIGHRECRYRRHKIPKNMGWLWNIVPSFGKPEFWRGYKPGAILKSVYKIMKKHRDSFDPLHLKKKKSKRVIENRHCIEVKKKEGEFHITVNPIKDPKTRNPMQSPYMDVTPLKFTVGKEKEESDAFCPCDIIEEERLSCPNSDFDFHFSPPAAIQDPIPKFKKPRAEMSVQYDIHDLSPSLRKKLGGKKKGGGGKSKKGKKK